MPPSFTLDGKIAGFRAAEYLGILMPEARMEVVPGHVDNH